MKAKTLSLFTYIHNISLRLVLRQVFIVLMLIGGQSIAKAQMMPTSIDSTDYNRVTVYSAKSTSTELDLNKILNLNLPNGSCASGTINVTNFIKLRLVPDIKKVFSQYFSFELKLEITPNIKVTPFVINLKVEYNPAAGTVFKDIDIFKFTGGKNVSIKILQPPSVGNTPVIYQKQDVWQYIELINEAQVETFETFDANTKVSGFNINSTETGHLSVSWDKMCGATEYDLEYLYIDDYEAIVDSAFQYFSKGVLNYNFKRGATRVTITNNKYRLPLVFEHGYLLFRIRPISKMPKSEQRIVGIWTNTESGLLDETQLNNYTYFIKIAHEQDKKNWQVITTFAEDSLRKDVVSYYDGTYRKRQTVTKLSTTDRAIVAETIYDYQGRPAVNVLPAPVDNNVIRYYNNFNQNPDREPYSRIDFDKDANLCQTIIRKMKADAQSSSLNVGASNYYSQYNSLINTEEGKAIPDAGGYPFSVTQYLQDNTGRISRQSGIGAVYLNDTMRHETSYFYGTPDQEELDRLFGNEVGHSIHYKKNAVQDANGQFSVSYMDADGKTIATALAGINPKNLERLDSFRTDALTIDLMAKNRVDSLSNALIAVKTHTVTTPDLYAFDYSVSPQAFSTKGGKGVDLCYDCIYDLELTIQKTGSCDTLYNKKIALGKLFKAGTTDSVSRTCDASAFNSIPHPFFKDTLQTGTYTITKKLMVNEQSVNRYVEDYLSTFKPLRDSILLKELAAVDTSGCDVKCANCEEDNGDPNMSLESVKDMVKMCREICDTTVVSSAISHDMMLNDMTPPFGQYAQVELNEDNDAEATAKDSLSIFNINNFLSKPNAQWRYSGIVFKDENGQPDLIPNSDGVLVPPNDPSITLQKFTTEFKPSWAEALLPFHPEYGLLEWSEKLNESEAFDLQMQMTDKWVQGITKPNSSAQKNNIILASNAKSLAYNNSAVTFGIVDNDPYFNSVTYGQNDKQAFLNKLNSYATEGGVSYNILQAALLIHNCPNAYNSTQRQSCLTNFTVGVNPEDDNTIWTNVFGLYNAEKQKLVLNARTQCSNSKGLNTDCIGIYNKYSNGAQHIAPCDDAHAKLYWNKVKRFPTANDAVADQTGGVDIYNMDTTQFKAVKNYVVKKYSLSCATCSIEDDWVTFINGYLSSKTTIPNNDIINGLSCRYLNRALFENLGRPEVINVLKEEGGSVLTFSLANGQSIMRWTRDNDAVWKGGSSVKINNGGTTWNVNNSTYNLINLSVTEPDSSVNNDSKIMLLIPFSNPCYVSRGSFYVEYPINSYLLNYADTLFTAEGSSFLSNGAWRLNGWTVDGVTQNTQEYLLPPYLIGENNKDRLVRNLLNILKNIDGNTTWIYDEATQSVKGGVIGKQYGNLSIVAVNPTGLGTYYYFRPAPLSKLAFSVRPRPLNKGYSGFNFFVNGTFKTIKGWMPNVYAIRDSLNVFDPSAAWAVSIGSPPCNDPGGYCNFYPYLIYIYNTNPTSKNYTAGNYQEADTSFTINPRFQSIVSTTPGDSIKYTIDPSVVGKSVAIDWKIDNQTFRFDFDFTTPNSITAQFNAINSGGNWTYDPLTHILKGKRTGNRYSKLQIYTSSNGFSGYASSNYKQRSVNGYLINGVNFQNNTFFHNIAWNNVKGRTYTFNRVPGLLAMLDSMNKVEPAGRWSYAGGFNNLQIFSVTNNSNYVADDIYLGSNIQLSPVDAAYESEPSYIINGQTLAECALPVVIKPCTATSISYNYDESLFNISSQTLLVQWNIGCDAPNTVIHNTNDLIDFMKSTDNGSLWSAVENNTKLVGGSGTKLYGKLNFYMRDNPPARQGSAPIDPIWILLQSVAPDIKETSTSSILYTQWNGITNKMDSTYIATNCSDCGVKDPIISPTVYADSISSCAAQMYAAARYNAELKYRQLLDSAGTAIRQQYIKRCLANVSEVFNVKYKVSEYHYTLYYYDQANNLIKTVPPAGVNIIINAATLSTIKQYRLNGSGTPYLNVHMLQTVYHYNSLNQVVDQQTPDAGVSNFWYDRLGRLILSQNARQKIDVAYSYTLFDKLGRITEVGETKNTARLDTNFTLTKSRIVVVCKDTTVALTKDTTVALYKTVTLKQWFTTKTYTYRVDSTYRLAYNSTYKICKDSIIYYQQDTTVIVNKSDIYWVIWQNKGAKRQITKTTYDAPLSIFINNQFGAKGQETPRNRVTTSAYYENGTDAAFQHATHYSYDILGNVKTLIQDYPEFAKKRMDYQFDQLSGKVNLVAYQAGQVDAFYHRYTYDADLRLQSVQTSRDFVIWDNDATYKYYRHGPLRRMEIGQDKIQGVDYYYSIQGWIKGVNHGAGGADSIGREGIANTVYANFAQDAFAYNLSYHTDDYKPISSNFAFDATEINHKIDNISASLFNGNIRAMWGGLDKFAISNNAATPPSAAGQVFQYDQLNRLLQSKDFTYFPNAQTVITAMAHYMKLSYDPNGNIKTLNRFGVVKTGNSGTTTAMDNLTYTYQPNTNKLTHVDDAIDAKNFANDIDDQTPNNYTYDPIGNLISDNAEEIQNITWNVYGKMTSVVNIKKERSLNFYYDAGGNRVKKLDGKDKATYYVRDAQGNVMAVYAQEKNKDITAESFYIYGSSRVGELDTSINMRTAAVSTFSFSRMRGIKRYEMSNHLGNVMVVVSDRKVYDGSVFKADLVSTTDYYAFGMVMSDRSYNTEGYRYGMNGQEKVDEISGIGNHNTAEFWEYDTRLGRRWNRDPIIKDYESPYSALGNNPIWYADFDGADTTQRNKAVGMAKKYVDLKKPGNQYDMGSKNGPGEKVDCSGLVSRCVMEGGEKNPNSGNKSSGVLNIENNLIKVNAKDIEVGNVVTFRNEKEKSYPYHTGIITAIERDENNNIKNITVIHSSGGVGPKKQTMSTETKYVFGKVRIEGYYKWDKIPDAPALQKPETSPSSFSVKKAWDTLKTGWNYAWKSIGNGLKEKLK